MFFYHLSVSSLPYHGEQTTTGDHQLTPDRQTNGYRTDETAASVNSFLLIML